MDKQIANRYVFLRLINVYVELFSDKYILIDINTYYRINIFMIDKDAFKDCSLLSHNSFSSSRILSMQIGLKIVRYNFNYNKE